MAIHEGDVMKPSLVILALVALAAAAGCGSTRAATKTVTVARPAKSSTVRPHEIAQFGYIKSLTRKGNAFEMQFDPAWFLSGETANAAAAADGAVEPGEPVPNDNYVVEEGHRLLTYAVPASTRVTVLTRGGNPEQLGATPITVPELARIVNGGKHRPLSEPIATGFWISVDVDTVRSLAQQYRP
jgi:hypothetical protein